MMGHSNNRYAQRARRYGWEDGIAEILIGIGAMLYAVLELLFFHVTLPGNRIGQIVLTAVGSGLVIFIGVVIFRAIAERIKARTTYPRTGFVEVKRPKVDWSASKVLLTLIITPLSALGGLALVLGLLILFALVNVNASLLILCGLYAWSAVAMGWHTKLTRLYMLAGAIMLVGVVLTVINTSRPVSLPVLMGVVGLVVSLSGVIGLMQFLHRHPKAEVAS